MNQSRSQQASQPKRNHNKNQSIHQSRNQYTNIQHIQWSNQPFNPSINQPITSINQTVSQSITSRLDNVGVPWFAPYFPGYCLFVMTGATFPTDLPWLVIPAAAANIWADMKFTWNTKQTNKQSYIHNWRFSQLTHLDQKMFLQSTRPCKTTIERLRSTTQWYVPGASCGLGPLSWSLSRISFFYVPFLPYSERQKAIVFW